jgi:hypothetical protein
MNPPPPLGVHNPAAYRDHTVHQLKSSDAARSTDARSSTTTSKALRASSRSSPSAGAVTALLCRISRRRLMLPLDDMDLPPPSFWNVPAEVRHTDDCTPEHPCVRAAKEHGDQHRHSQHSDPARHRIDARTGWYQVVGL